MGDTLNGKRCPMCNHAIFDWEVLCSNCWKQVKLHDAMQGTHYIEDFLAGKKPVFGIDDSLAEQIKWIKNKRRVMLRDICSELCRRCNIPEKSTVAGEDKCSQCHWRRYSNYLLSEYDME